MNLRFETRYSDQIMIMYGKEEAQVWHLHIGTLHTRKGRAHLDEVIAWFEARELPLEKIPDENLQHHHHAFQDPDLAFEYRMTWM